MRMHSLLLALFTTLLAGNALAGTMGTVTSEPDWGWLDKSTEKKCENCGEPDWTGVASFSGGVLWANGGETQTIFLTPEIVKTYNTKKSSNPFASGEIFLGVQKTLTPKSCAQLGLALGLRGNAEVKGIIWDDADPQFDNHNYEYKVWQSRIAVKGSLLLNTAFSITPWIGGSLGVGFNRAHNFTNTPRIFEALPNCNFSSHTQTAFTYSLGAGVQQTIMKHYQVGVGYEYADWGKSQLGSAKGQTLNTNLKLDHLYTHGILFNLTYLS